MRAAEEDRDNVESHEDDGFRGRIVGAVTFVAGGLIGSNLVRVVSNVLLARILVPEDFGVMALISTVLIALGLFSDMGIEANIIHSKRGTDPVFQDTAWCFGMIRGAVLWLICVLLAWPLASFYDVPELRFLLPIAGVTSLLNGLKSTRVAVHGRELRSRKIEIMNFTCYASSVLLMIGWALISPTVIALLAGSVANILFMVIWSHLFLTGHRNGFRWDKDCAVEIFGFGRWVFVSTAAGFIAQRSDNLFIGKLATIAELGVFGFAVAISSIASFLANHLCGKIIFPLYSRYVSEGGDGLPGKIRGARGIMLPSFVLMAVGTAVVCDPFFKYLYTEEYQDAIWMCQLLCVSVFFTILKTSSDRAFLAIGDSRALAISNLLGGLIKFVVAVPAGIHFGIAGFIAGVLVGAIANEVVTAILLRRVGISVFSQDLRYMGIAGLSGLVCLGLPRVINLRSDIPLELLQYGVATPVLLGLAWWSFTRLRLGMRSRE